MVQRIFQLQAWRCPQSASPQLPLHGPFRGSAALRNGVKRLCSHVRIPPTSPTSSTETLRGPPVAFHTCFWLHPHWAARSNSFVPPVFLSFLGLLGCSQPNFLQLLSLFPTSPPDGNKLRSRVLSRKSALPRKGNQPSFVCFQFILV